MMNESHTTDIDYYWRHDKDGMSTALPSETNVCIFAQEISMTFNIVTLLIGFIIIGGNTLVLLVLLRYPAKRFTPLHWLLFHLAIADLLIGLTVFFWYGIAELLQLPVSLYVKVIFYGFSIVAVMASFQGLMMIAVDRYMLILHTVKYQTTITRQRTVCVILFMWIMPITMQVIAPMLGWSCVELCDCRIHNLHPDAKYCFDESCSQQLPPLTKLQLLLASAMSSVTFLFTVVIYALMFYGIHKQSQKIRHSTANSRKSSSGSQQTQLSSTNGTKNNAALPTLSNACRTTPDDDVFIPVNGAFQFNVVNTDSREGCSHNNTDETQLTDSSRESNKQEEKLNPVSPPRTPISPGVSKPVLYRKAESTQATSPKVVMRPKSKKSLPSNQRQSVTQSMIGTLRRLTAAKKRRRTKVGRRRDVRVMRSMFAIMTVFVITTCPLMIFIMYTYAHNDRSLKEIFNILLQITTLNSLLNPFLYFSRVPAMRTRFHKLMKTRYWRNLWMVHVKKEQPPTNVPPYGDGQSDSWESGQSESNNA